MKEYTTVKDYIKNRTAEKKIDETSERYQREGELTRLRMLAELLEKDIADRTQRLEAGDYKEPPSATKYYIGF